MLKFYPILFTSIFLLPVAALAQTGVGTASPDASAALDVTATTRGLLAPRVALTAANAAAPLTLPATALLVYNTNTAMPGGVGFYYNAGTPATPAWVKLVATASPSGGDTWLTGGNAGTTAGTQFIGTTDPQDVVFKANGTEWLRLSQTGDVGIGTTPTPARRLHVTGTAGTPNIRLSSLGGTGSRIVVADANGDLNTQAIPAAGSDWTLDGNTVGAIKWLGTVDNFDLPLRTNSVERLRLKTNGAVWQSMLNTGNTAFGNNTGAALAAGTNNTLVGDGVGDAITNGGDNTYIGRNSGGASNTANNNTFVGSGAGDVVTTGSNNTFVGKDAGGAVTGNASSTFIGYRAGIVNTAAANTFLGADAGDANTSGAQNTFLGRAAGGANATGASNTFLGFSAGLVNTASNNTFLGSNAGSANVGGSNNVYVGRDVATSNVSGLGNTIIGDNAGALSTADFNTFVGRSTGAATTGGTSNTFIGNAAGASNTGGSSNTLVGSGTDSSPNLTNATAIGAGTTVTQSNSLILGTSAVSVGIGISAPAQRLHVNGTNGTPNVRLTSLGGTGVRMVVADANGDLNTQAIPGGGGGWALDGNTVGAIKWLGTIDNFELPFRTNSVERLRLKTNGAVWQTMASTTNTAFGNNTATAVTSATNTTLVGNGAGAAITTVANNTLVGHNAGTAITGAGNTFVGATAGDAVVGGTNNVGLGLDAGSATTSGGSNAFLGQAAGATNTTGSNNTFVGQGADASANNFSNATAIGSGAIAGATNALVLGNASANVGIGINAPAQRLHVNGTNGTPNVRLTSLGGTGVRMVVADANGDLNTQAIPGGGGGWALDGNTVGAIRWLGTIDNFDLPLRTNSVERLRLKTSGILWQTLQAGCTAMGTNAFNGTASGTNNSIFGTDAGTTITIGSSNTLMGYTSGATLTSGGGNVLIGTSSGNAITTGASNVLVGSAAGAALQTGAQNTLIGNATNVGAAAISNATAIGNGAVAGTTNAFVLGNNSVNVGIGVSSPLQRFHVAGTGGTPNVRLGALSGTGVRMVVADANGDLNTQAIPGGGGGWALDGNTVGALRWLGTIDNFDMPFRTNNVERLRLKAGGLVYQFIQQSCTSFGNNAFNTTATGTDNTIFGTDAGYSLTTGSTNVLVGSNAGSNLTTGFRNTFIGRGNGTSMTGGANNTFVGGQSGGSAVGDRNTTLGALAGGGLIAGGDNVLLGYNAGNAITGANGNVMVGSGAGITCIAGSNNTLVGNGADIAFQALTNCTAIGNGAIATALNAFVLGNNSVNVGIGTGAPDRRFHVAGTAGTPNVRLSSLGGTGTRLVTADVNGDLNATNAPAVASIDVSGSVAKGYTTLSANTTLDATHYTVRRFGGCNTITLPNANTCTRRIYVIINSNGLGAFTLSVTGGGQVYDDLTNTNFASGLNAFPATTRLQIQSDGTNWLVIGR